MNVGVTNYYSSLFLHQIQITYTRPDGMRCLRVLSKSAPTTTSRKEMEEVCICLLDFNEDG